MWVLIVIIMGWGAGVGSTGNAIAMAEFTSEARCRDAAVKVLAIDGVRGKNGPMWAICSEK